MSTYLRSSHFHSNSDVSITRNLICMQYANVISKALYCVSLLASFLIFYFFLVY